MKIAVVSGLALLVFAFVAAARIDQLRSGYHAGAFRLTLVRLGLTVQRDQMVRMPDGVHLATDVYLPRSMQGQIPALLIRLPYDKTTYGGALSWVHDFGPRGYAVVLQDMRGRYASEGVFAPYAHGAEDGTATIDWIAAQPWSNGRVATAGCSALGEIQVIQSTTLNPHLTAMIAEGEGGAIGLGGASRSYFGMFEGGIPNLAVAFGWFSMHGGKSGRDMGPANVDPAAVIGGLPSGSLVSRYRTGPTDYEDFMARFEDDSYWRELGFLNGSERFSAPALHVNTWHDVAIRGTFEIADLMRRNATTAAARAHQHVIVGPGLHCDFFSPFATGATGDMPVAKNAGINLHGLYADWIDHWLRDGPAPDLTAYTYYVLGADRWDTSDTWPPAEAKPVLWFLADDGELSTTPAPPGKASFEYDPAAPTPSLGGPICCTGDAALRAGPLDQRSNAARPEVLSYVSPVLEDGLQIVGDVKADVRFSSTAPDTDLVAILIDQAQDGSMLTITQGALRLRYREGFGAPRLMEPGQPVRATVAFAPIAYKIAPGHRLGLHLSSSSFPRLERNLNGPGPNHLASEPRTATNTVHHGPGESVLILPVVDRLLGER